MKTENLNSDKADVMGCKKGAAVELLNVDCMEYLKNCHDKQFDLAVVDVPYGINASNYERGGTQYGASAAKCKTYEKKDWDKTPPPPEYFTELIRVSKNQIVWGANHFINLIPFASPCWIVWDKVNGDNGYADCELAWTSFKTAVRKVKHRWHGMLQADMKNKEIRIHPTQKPVNLYKWLFDEYAEKGQKVLDTHLGSGSSAIAAHYAGLDFVGLEIDTTYFNDAQKRFKEITSQTQLF